MNLATTHSRGDDRKKYSAARDLIAKKMTPTADQTWDELKKGLEAQSR